MLLDYDRGVRHDRVLLRRDGVRAAEGLRRRVGQVVVQRRQYGVRRRNDHGSDGGDGSTPNPSPTPVPDMGGCATGQTQCPGGCVDEASDVNNCGSCGYRCPAGPSGTAPGPAPTGSAHVRVLGTRSSRSAATTPTTRRRGSASICSRTRRTAASASTVLQLARKRHGVVPERAARHGLRGRLLATTAITSASP